MGAKCYNYLPSGLIFFQDLFTFHDHNILYNQNKILADKTVVLESLDKWGIRVRVMLFNATSNNISVISWHWTND